jgi:hypothetical protein
MTPSPVWASGTVDPRLPAFQQPWLAEFDGDRFLPDFLDLMGGQVAGKTPADLATMAPQLTDGVRKLYQPLHGRYYLVTGSLVCRQLGLPDRTVARRDGERTSFVVRRLMPDGTGGGTQEQGWVKQGATGSWQPATGDALLDGEERQPVHHVAACAILPAGAIAGPDIFGLSECGRRTVYYGYIPVASREMYLEQVANPAQALQDVMNNPDPGTTPEPDPRVDDLDTRVLRMWRGLYVNLSTTPPQPWPGDSATAKRLAENGGEQRKKVSLYLILDLADFLNSYLPDVFAALGTDGSALQAPGEADAKALFDELTGIKGIERVSPDPNGGTKTDHITLADALNDLKGDLTLVQGQGSEPASTYDVLPATHHDGVNDVRVDANNAAYLASDGPLAALFGTALSSTGRPVLVPDEVADMIKHDPPGGDSYWLRLVYEHAPCVPVISAPSPTFTMAKVMDPDAPARHIRIEMPSIGDLRKFKRGIGMEVPPDLRSLMDRVNPDMAKGGGLSDGGPSWQLGMICSFSIQIVMMVAFIVMFIFLLLLNFVFWWLAFLKICFPIPVKK